MTTGDQVYQNESIIGTCSICGGPVVVPTVWYSTEHPTPQCKRCFAYKDDDFGPVIKMKWPNGPFSVEPKGTNS